MVFVGEQHAVAAQAEGGVPHRFQATTHICDAPAGQQPEIGATRFAHAHDDRRRRVELTRVPVGVRALAWDLDRQRAQLRLEDTGRGA